MERLREKPKIKIYPSIHFVPYIAETPFGADAYTYGLNEYNHLELECVFPLFHSEIVSIINPLINMILQGHHLSEGYYKNPLMNDYVMYFIEVKDIWGSNKSVLRIIVPDEENKMPWDEGCNPYYAEQIFDIPQEKIKAVINKQGGPQCYGK